MCVEHVKQAINRVIHACAILQEVDSVLQRKIVNEREHLDHLGGLSVRSYLCHGPAAGHPQTHFAYKALHTESAYKALNNKDYVQSVRIMWCFICRVSVLVSSL